LSQPLRGPEDKQAWEKAMRELREAEALDLSRTPGAGVHKSYYAMHHAARAVLLRIDGEKAATKHGSVIGRFGQIAKLDGNVMLVSAARDINRVYDERIESDYNTLDITTEEDAKDCLAKAQNFMRVCGQTFGFAPN
jgi:uncharacterized protein (UPF0332 family)